jgi:predicted enzyme involved in methoxymalonyl-ACP biosynthesis
VGRYIPTAKNAMVKDFYQRFGFQQVEAASASDGTTWRLGVNDYVPREVHISEVATFDRGGAQ